LNVHLQGLPHRLKLLLEHLGLRSAGFPKLLRLPCVPQNHYARKKENECLREQQPLRYSHKERALILQDSFALATDGQAQETLSAFHPLARRNACSHRCDYG
jgi:hypothetical protein